jgi:mannose-6-phosphate isomerase-like protein (cupin superfamily)
MAKAFTLTSTYLHLHGGEAERMIVDEAFWPRVISGERPLPGWLVAGFEFAATDGDAASGHSEVHPNGDEIHICVDGAMTAIFEHPEGQERIDFGAGESCLVPAGVWHRLVGRVPSRVVSLTFGEGSQHRPASADLPG